MTTVANIKGYINDEEWGVYEPAPELMTYEQIIAMATAEQYTYTNTLTELNINADAYYNMLNEGGKLISDGDLLTVGLSWIGPSAKYINGTSYIAWNNNEWIRAIHYDGGGGEPA